MLMQAGLAAALVGAVSQVAAETYAVPTTANKIGQPFEAFVSYSLEFSSFPEYAGMKPPQALSAGAVEILLLWSSHRLPIQCIAH